MKNGFINKSIAFPIIVTTKYPLNIWFVFLLVAIEGVFIIDGPIFRTLFCLIGTFFFLYIFLSRYAAKVEIREDEILVKYFFFWDKDVSFPIGEIKSVDYEKGFFDLFNDKTISGQHVFPMYCYDKLIIKTKSETIGICVNTRMFMFDRVIVLLQKEIS